MKAPKEYFNLYVEYQNTESTEEEIYNTFAYTVLDTDELNQYIDLVKRKSWGEHAIGNHNLQVVPAHTIKIFDLSNVVHIGDVYSREELLKMVPVVPWTKIPLLEQLEKYGADVTKELFGEELELFLDRLQLEIQIEQRGINAETGEPGSLFSEGNIKGQVKGGSPVEGSLGDKASRIYPKEFEEGILDGSMKPAFNVEKIASVFANHLKNLKHENGQMIGVFGQWGRGKSYFVRQVLNQLGLTPKEEKHKIGIVIKIWFAVIYIWNVILNPWQTIKKIFNKNKKKDELHFCLIKFQAWKYQSTPSIWAYLFEIFLKQYLKVNWWNKIWRTVHLSVVRRGTWKAWGKSVTILVFGILSIVLVPSILQFFPDIKDIDLYQDILQILGGAGLASFVIARLNSFFKFAKKPALHLFNLLSKIPSFKHVLGIQEEIHKELISLIKAWKNSLGDKRLLLFIDDLDRCSHDSLIEIVDSLRVMLDDEEINKHVLVLMAVDEDKLQRVIQIKYENLYKEEDDLNTIAVEYLDKLFISAIKLYPISDDERAEFIKKIAKQINQEEIENAQTGEKQEEDNTRPEESELDEETQNSEEESVGTLDSDQEEEVIPVIADFKNETGKQQNLDKTEIDALSEKIKLANKEITPRQIRIVVYRYLLARNLWLAFYGNLDWKIDDAINEIMGLSGFTEEGSNAVTKVNGGLHKICQMVVAY